MTKRNPRTIKSLEKSGFTAEEINLWFFIIDSALVGVTATKLTKWLLNLKRGDGIPAKNEIIARIILLIDLGKDTTSLQALKLRYGENSGSRKHATRIEAVTSTKESIIAKYGAEHWSKSSQNRGASLENYIRKHGAEQGVVKWNQYVVKRRNTYHARKEAGRNYNSFDIKKYIAKYGEELGVSKWQDMRNDVIYKNSKKYLLDKFDAKTANDVSKKRWGLTTKAAFITRYGEDHGTKKYASFIQILRNKMSLEYMVQKHGESIGYQLWARNCWKSVKASPASMKFFKSVSDLFGNTFHFEKPIFLNTTERKCINQKILFVDACYGNKVIEFFGDAWHANPTLFSADQTPHPFDKTKTARDFWDRDRKRLEILNDKGYQTLVVWEHEVKTNYDETVSKCLRWLCE